MKNNKRLMRINDEIKKELAEILRGGELKDPRISTITTVMKTDTSSDLSFCKVGISVFGDDAAKAEIMQVIRNAAGYIRKLIAERLDLRQTPAFTFVLDDSVEYGIRMTEMIRKVNNDD
jgi:ribosome-binding factor A